ncbi:MAG: DUF748 domain-containing protein [Nitrospira sp.]|jgi:uncharacterized protein involved in outer membrane biogenesis|nr:DUF748 domain-containing protein [Nitrospira sp.]
MLRPRIVASLAGALLLYSLIGFLAVPYLITQYAVPAVAEKIRHPVSVKDVAFNPFTLALTIDGLEIREPDQTPLLGFEQFSVNVHAKTLLLRAYAFEEIRLVMPFVSMKVSAEGKMNLLGLLPPPQPGAEAAGGSKKPSGGGASVPLEIGLLTIERGIVEFRDESKPKPFELSIVPIQISLRNFTTVRGGENAYAFTAEIGKGESLAWEGRVSLEPVESDGKLSLSGVRLRPLAQYVQDRVGFEVRQGQLSIGGQYHIDLKGEAPNIVVSDGTLSIIDLAIGEKGADAPVVSIPSFAIDGLGVDVLKKQVAAVHVHSAGARFEVWINPGGVLNYQQLFAASGEPERAAGKQQTEAAAVAAPEHPWSIDIKEVVLNNYRAIFEDRTLERPSHLEIDGFDLTVKGLKLPLRQALGVDVAFKLNQAGRVGAKGSVTVDPLTADLDLNVKEVGLRPFQPYLDPFADIDVRDGVLELGGKLHIAKEHSRSPFLTYQGNLAVNRVSITDRQDFDELLSWRRLGLNRVVLDVEPTSVKIGEVVLQEPAVSLVVQSDGTLNLAQIAKHPPLESSAQPVKPAPEKPAKPVPVNIEAVKLINASATFRDRSIQPAVKVGISELTGSIKGLSSRELAKAEVLLTGKVDRVAPLQIKGQINPLSEDAYTDLAVKFENVDLLAASSYAGKYAGYPITKGKLFLDLAYKIAKKELAGENKVLIDQLTFGGKTESPDATSLPVPLAVALLKDRKGQIDVDLPVRGNLDDPDFKYGRVLLNTLLNLLGKVATSPLSLVGALIGGSGDELRFVEFPAGRSEWGEAETKKLAALVTVLTERPGLSLDITGAADRQADRRVLAERQLREQLRQAKLKEAGGSDREVKPDSPLPAEEEASLVAARFAQQFPSAGASEKPAPSVSEMKARLLEAMVVEEAALRLLARERAERIREWLIQEGEIGEARIFLVEAALKEGTGTTVQTDLNLAAR